MTGPFAESMANVPDPPCVGCALRRHCGEQLLACSAFQQYIDHGTWRPDAPRVPRRRTFLTVYADTPIAAQLSRGVPTRAQRPNTSEGRAVGPGPSCVPLTGAATTRGFRQFSASHRPSTT